MVYDKPPIVSSLDPQIATINNFITRIVRSAFPGAHYVEYFTWMNYLPSSIAPWKKEAEAWYKKDSQFFEGLFREAKGRVVRFMVILIPSCSDFYSQKGGDERPSFAGALVHNAERHGLSDRESAWLAATL